MKVYKITDAEFSEYGMVLEGYDFKSFLGALSTLEIPSDGITYKPSVNVLEKDKEFTKMLELHLIMIYSDNNFYEIEYLGRQAIVEHYSYEEFVIRRKK